MLFLQRHSDNLGRIEIIPHCIWYHYRNPILKKVADKYLGTYSKKKAA